MEIEMKYDVNQDVYIIGDNKTSILKGKIECVFFQEGVEGEIIKDYSILVDSKYNYYKKEKDIYPTFEECRVAMG